MSNHDKLKVRQTESKKNAFKELTIIRDTIFWIDVVGEVQNENAIFEETSTWAELPHKFEAGTPAIAEAIGLAEAISYIKNIGLKEIHEYEKTITKYLFEKLNQIENIEIIGPSPEIDPDRASLATFYIKNIHSNDIAEILDSQGICIRSGHHCCQPLHRYIGIKSTARISMNFTTNKEEIDMFIEKLKDTINFLKINS